MQSKDPSNAGTVSLDCQRGADWVSTVLGVPGLGRFRGEFCQDFQVFSPLLARRTVCVTGAATLTKFCEDRGGSLGGHPIHSPWLFPCCLWCTCRLGLSSCFLEAETGSAAGGSPKPVQRRGGTYLPFLPSSLTSASNAELCQGPLCPHLGEACVEGVRPNHTFLQVLNDCSVPLPGCTGPSYHDVIGTVESC